MITKQRVIASVEQLLGARASGDPERIAEWEAEVDEIVALARFGAYAVLNRSESEAPKHNRSGVRKRKRVIQGGSNS